MLIIRLGGDRVLSPHRAPISCSAIAPKRRIGTPHRAASPKAPTFGALLRHTHVNIAT